jgi:hypothetical protein
MVAGKVGFTEIARGRPMHGTTHSLASRRHRRFLNCRESSSARQVNRSQTQRFWLRRTHSGAEPPVSVPDRVKTAADGTFVIRQLSRGDYVLRAAAAVVSPSDNPDQQSIRYMASSPAAQGGPLVTETAGGFTSEYRFDPIGGVALSVRNGNISGIRLVVSR